MGPYAPSAAAAATRLCPALLALAAVQAPDAGGSGERIGEEGPLANDTFLAESVAATARLLEGDELLGPLLAGPVTGTETREWTQVFEAWMAALTESADGDAARLANERDEEAVSPWPDPDRTHARRIEGVAHGVLRRLALLGERTDGRGPIGWRERFGTLAEEDLALAGRQADALARVERRFPATPAAVRAAILCADVALESGRPVAARTWLERAVRHARIGRLQEPRAALDARLRIVDTLRDEEEDAGREAEELAAAWRGVDELEAVGRIAIPDPEVDLGLQRNPALLRRPGPGRGVQPGWMPLDGGRVVIQTLARVHVLHGEGPLPETSFEPERLLPETGWELGSVRVRRQAPGWPLVLARADGALVLVQGGLEQDLLDPDVVRPNALIAVEPPRSPSRSQSLPPLPQLRWAVRGARHVDAGGAERSIEELVELGDYEFQPGPVIVGSIVVAQAWKRAVADIDRPGTDPRFRSSGDVLAWLLAFDLRDGRLLWKRFLCKGVERAPGQVRIGGPSAQVSCGQPLARVGRRVFVGTHLGAALLVDAVDGRVVWGLLTRRIAADTPGWSGLAPTVIADPPAVLYAPADGDHLYRLRGDPDLDGRGLFLRAPLARGGADSLIGGDLQAAWVLGSSGPRAAVAALVGERGLRRDSLHLGLAESFTGQGLLLSDRVLASTDRGVYLLDAERELYLLDCADLGEGDGSPVPRGGSLHATPERLFVVGPRMVWVMEGRR